MNSSVEAGPPGNLMLKTKYATNSMLTPTAMSSMWLATTCLSRTSIIRFTVNRDSPAMALTQLNTDVALTDIRVTKRLRRDGVFLHHNGGGQWADVDDISRRSLIQTG
ncbi:hypothetical protein NP493_1421g01024 [Ridgeia piscesae]|uniref:Uncharacterized protein n=1 Tax=Ridgeia piscesae TaxID=27915 RepID=A0AAD9NBM2_RIDPI|nr:hypothetical protein NP493_1421g01024 [Ridgeia piscesae]